MAEVNAPSVLVSADGRHYVTIAFDPATGGSRSFTLVCPIKGETCAPWREIRWTQDLPPLFGAALLAGREVRPGDERAVGNVSIRVAAPQADSPEGTAFVGLVSYGNSTVSMGWLSDPARLHFAASSPFPLRVDLPRGTFTLDGTSGIPVEPWAVPAPPRPMQAVAWTGGLPPEGDVPAAYPSLSDAIASTRTAGGPVGSASTRSVGLTVDRSWTDPAPGAPRWSTTTFKFELWRADEPTGYVFTKLRRDYGTPVDEPWAVVRGGIERPPLACLEGSVPIWSMLGRALESRTLTELRSYGFVGPCELTATGSPPISGTSSVSFTERLVFDGRTGLLVSALVWVGDEPPS